MDFPMHFIRNSEKFCNIDNYVSAPYFRKSFVLSSDNIDKAILFICGLGFYEVHLNGLNITKGFLAPYRSNHDDYIYYDEYNLKDKLVLGKNVISVVLGNGFQNPMAQNWRFNQTPWRSAPALDFCISIEYSDGKKQTEVSDTDTKTADSPIIFNDLHYGEYYDARHEIIGWDAIDFDDSDWKNSEIAPIPRGIPKICNVEPIKKRKEIYPVSITKYDTGYIYDFGVNDSGVCKLSIDGVKGQKILLQHFEKLVDNKPFFNNIKFKPEQRFQEDEYICSGNGVETFLPKFTYHGFRYVYVTGIKDEQAKKSLLTFITMSSDIKQIGSFECSDEVINRIQEATLRSDISNFYYFPTDCPQREKNGWTADASLSAEQMLFNFKPEKSYKEWLLNIYASMDDMGRVPGIIPNSGWGYDGYNGPAWDNVIVNLPYYVYIYRGDKSLFYDLKAPLMRYLRFLHSLLDADDLIEYGLGDWCQVNTKSEGAFDTPKVITNSIMAVDIANKSALIYDILDMSEQAEYAENLAVRIKTALRRVHYDINSMSSNCNTQTAQAMAIYYNIFEENEKPKAVENLLKLINENNGFMNVGVLGGRVLFRVLAENGYADLAYNMISRPEFPSYGNWIQRGATTLWELFTLNDTAKGSLNHHFWGDVSAWFYIYLAGIKINVTGYNPNNVNISPCFVEKLNYVKAEHMLPSGKLSVFWKRYGEIIKLIINVPVKVNGLIIINDGYKFIDGSNCKQLNSGEYIIFKV